MAILIRSGLISLLLSLLLSVQHSAQTAKKAEVWDAILLQRAFVSILNERPGGMVIVGLDCTDPGHDRSPTLSGSFQEKLDLLGIGNPEYRIKVEDKVVNLFPNDYLPAFLLNKVRTFRTNSRTDPSRALEDLLNQPEIAGEAVLKNVNQGLQVVVGRSRQPEKGELREIELNDVTLVEALNKLAVFYGKGIWSFREFQCGGVKTASLSFVR